MVNTGRLLLLEGKLKSPSSVETETKFSVNVIVEKLNVDVLTEAKLVF